MQNSFFNKIFVVIFLLASFSIKAQVRVKGNNTIGNKKMVVKSNRSSKYTTNRVVKNTNRGKVKINRNRIITKKPNRPNRIVKRPSYKRPGYIWMDGYWQWNNFYGRYIWKQARWKKIKRNHYWIPGFWEITLGGFVWVQGYWALEY